MVKDTKFYDLLGVTPDATDEQIKKGYRKKARENHPDLHHDDPNATVKFQQIGEAYEILKDPKKRQMYDHFGPPPWPEMDTNVIRRTPDIRKGWTATLEELYNGKDHDLKITRRVICSACNGSGCLKGKRAEPCTLCHGQGRVLQGMRTPMGFTQVVTECPKCHGVGEFLSDADKCPECKGERVIVQPRDLHVHIEPGMRNGDKLVFEGMGSEAPGFDPGDIILVIMEEKHDRFKRNGDDLLITQKITLQEALLGTTFTIKHLDGRLLVIKTDPTSVVENGSVKVVENEGMPRKEDRYQKGRLFIQFNVTFPDWKDLSPEFLALVRKELPPPDNLKDVNLDDDNTYECDSKDADASEFEEKHEEEEEESGPQGVQCNPM